MVPPVSGGCTAPTDARLNPLSPYSITDMEESGEECTVVFALIVTEPARRGRGETIPPPPLTNTLMSTIPN